MSCSETCNTLFYHLIHLSGVFAKSRRSPTNAQTITLIKVISKSTFNFRFRTGCGCFGKSRLLIENTPEADGTALFGPDRVLV